MSDFIADVIMNRAMTSIEDGMQKYRAYFINTHLYSKYKNDVDSILTKNGMEACIS